MKRLERLFAINEALRRASPRPVSAARLAEEFGVTRRTIERDIAALKASGVPLYSEPGRAGGQLSLDQLGNVIVTLTPVEVTALITAIKAGGSTIPWSEAGRTATKRLLDALPTSSRLGVEELRSRIRVRSTEPNARRGVKRTVEAAVQDGTVVNLEYEDGSGTITNRRVEALGFYEGADGWCLVGWCHLRKAGRIFRLDRIRKAHASKTANQPRDLDQVLGWTPGASSAP